MPRSLPLELFVLGTLAPSEQGGVMQIRVKRVAIATVSGLTVLLLGHTALAWGIHRYRVWANAGVWCALGSPEEGWQFGYGPEECPGLEAHPQQISTEKVPL